MSFTPPANSDILKSFSALQGLTLLDTGGFKAVYKVDVSGRVEAFKLILIPTYAGSPDADALRKESIARIRREVEALGKCVGRHLVKLGSVSLISATIGGADYV